ncbi:G-type lectin S-receptor-like serine/threonine-protein kinase At4g03230 [Bidens hawaiensis]|uniref:G-type lectin S-receptor-like serine/threonine-protein kinase At4g03230 n=1 Tax=Bidens hawaiensis TaxID=980011 RepID=UPI00404ADAE7
MGFFSRGNTSEVRQYVGIWYTKDPNTIVWVANRDKPVLDSTGVMTVEADGNFKVLNKNATVYFSTAAVGAPLTALKLLDTGNAILINVSSGRILWQSFETPTDMFIPGMIMGTNTTLTSWKSINDPGSGSFKFQLEPGTHRYSIMNGSMAYLWKSGKFTDSFDENQMSSNAMNLLSNATTQRVTGNMSNGNLSYYAISVVDLSSRLVMDHLGKLQYLCWSEATRQWDLEWEEPKDACSFYRVCGLFGMCTGNNDSLCTCLPGFEPISPDDYKHGCKRTTEICDKGTKDTFIKRPMISMDDTTVPIHNTDDESECIKECLGNCNCLAYSYSPRKEGGMWDSSRENKHGCWFWDTEPINLKGKGTHNISFRVSESKKGTISLSPKQVLAISVVVSALVLSLFCGISYICYKRLVNRRNNNQDNVEFQSHNARTHIHELLHLDHSKEDDREGPDVPYFELESIIAATNDFSEENRLGQGGFGPVYKGKLTGGQEIAVKRLSSLSGQGLQEFKNEVSLISRLQHRNLVRLLGYCIRGEEKMLLYEYMPNRSLDLFIFDRTLCASLDWKMRFNIIMGIARGLNYLHHDSRLRIIHRDLKTSNVLLDEDMNPKISDFGLAKIVEGKDIEDITSRVVGTFGYMSPEYALGGLFSIKSDAFSFGVVLLEIVSGKKNTGFYESQTSLLGHAWSLWIEDRPFDLLDQKLMKSYNSSEVLKCISVGLLCVQGDPDDRPTMTNVVMMLGGDMATLPNPKEPAFVSRRDHVSSSSSSSSKQDSQTKNMLTITELVGR